MNQEGKTYTQTVLENQLFLQGKVIENTQKERDYYRLSSLLLSGCLGFMCVVIFLISIL